MEKLKKVISTAVTFFLIISVMLCFFIIVKTVTGNDPSFLGYRYFYLISGSMEPTIPTGALVVVHKEDSYEVNEVITFISENSAIYGSPNTHRIAEIIERDDGSLLYRTKGDANELTDVELVSEEQIYGKVVFHTGSMLWLGKLIEMLLSPGGFVMLILIPILLVASGFMKDYIKSYKKAVEEMKKGIAAEETENAKENTAAEITEFPKNEVTPKKTETEENAEKAVTENEEKTEIKAGTENEEETEIKAGTEEVTEKKEVNTDELQGLTEEEEI